MYVTRITATELAFFGRKVLNEPLYIDVLETAYMPPLVTRFNAKLQNTFLVGTMVYAVWVTDLWIGDVYGPFKDGRPSV